MIDKWSAQQLQVCTEHDVSPVDVAATQKVGIAMNVKSSALPINGVRHLPEHGTCGWYIWAGEMSEDPDFFVPLHVEHLEEWCEAAMPFLLLPPGWCFQVAPGQRDVWFDSAVDLAPLPGPGSDS